MTFSTIVAYGVFATTSVIWLIILWSVYYDNINKNGIRMREFEDLKLRMHGKKRTTNWTMLAILFAMWFGSGFFLFG